ncbi:MAG: T9SS type A sorting domain-containing protein [Bacteroidota bacterium]
MKKAIYLFIVTVFSLSVATAQNFDLNPKSSFAEGPNADPDEKTAMSVITNNSTDPGDSMITWTIVDFNVPSGWQFDFCDPYDCISNLGANATNSFKLKPGLSGPLKGNFYSKSVGGNGNVKLAIQFVGKPESRDTLFLSAKGWATGLKQIRNAAEVSMYPNPARNEISFKYPVTKAVEVSIYNVLGSKVKTFTHNGTETAINISELQKGLYFIRFNQGEAMISKSFTKVD